MDDTSPSEAVGLMGGLVLRDTASTHGAHLMKVGQKRGAGVQMGRMGPNEM